MVVTITLNPALDRILFVRDYKPNESNRIYREQTCIGGKGAHVSLNLANLGMETVASGVAMGENGRRILSMLSEAGVPCSFLVGDNGEARINDVVVEDNGSCTLLCQQGPALDAQCRTAFLALFSGLVFGADYVVVSGDAGNVGGEEGAAFFQALLKRCEDAGARVLLDANGRLLAEGVRLSPYLIKPNAAELSELTGLPADTQSEVVSAIYALDDCRIPIVAVSRGAAGSIVRYFDTLYRVGTANVTVQNTVGCGDAYLAGLVYGLESGFAPEECLAFAAACGGAEAENPLTVGLDPVRVQALKQQITIEEMKG